MEDFVDESIQTTIVNKHDYSNAIVGEEQFKYIINYLEGIMSNFDDMMSKEEEKNKTVKTEYQHYDFKKCYLTGFRVSLRNDKVGYKNYENIQTFKEDFNNKLLTNLEYIKIELNLSFKRGIGYDLVEYKNSFSINFKPYDIVFTRESDHNVMIMNKVEENIFNMLNQLPVANTIFCSKGA